jgi:hypothetical protein
MIDERISRGDVRTCREVSCRAQVVFAETPSGRVCPIDVEPDPAGPYVLVAWAPKAYLLAKVTDGDADPTDPRFTSHFTTCKAPGRFSKHSNKRRKK